MKQILAASCATLAIIGATSGYANENIAYRYDAKGRLIEVRRTGTVNNNVVTAYSMDKADNRLAVVTTGSLNTGPSSPPPPPPPPPSSNSPPVPGAVPTQNIIRCTARSVNVTSGATDPENNLPITVIAANGSSGRGVATVALNAVQYEAFVTTGTDIVTYTLSDSLGATANGTFYVNITAGTCN